MGFDILGALKSAVPWIARTLPLPPPLGNLAANALQSVLGTKDATEDTLTQALATATPEQIANLKKADEDFALQMQQLGFKNIEDLEKIAADDRASARQREMTVKDNTPRVLAYGYGIMFLVTLVAFIWIAFAHIDILPSVKTSIDILLGCEIGMVLGSKEYYFGSSSGSRAKDDTIQKLSQ